MKGSGAALVQRPVLTAVRAVIFGAVAGAALCAVLLALCSIAFVSSENLPHGFLKPFILGISVLSAGFSGFIAAKILKRRGLIFGTLSGLLLFLLFLTAGLTLSEGGGAKEAGIRLLVMALSGGIGGFLSVNGKSRKK